MSNINEDTNGLQCDVCTFLNDSDADVCEVCGSNMYFDHLLYGSDGSDAEVDILGNLLDMEERMKV